jgi:uncharacterized membrane protein
MGGYNRKYAKDFLFALNIFIAFLLLFESRLVVPQWLQPLGRMHPMILHFPIVLLLLSMVMEFFRFKSAYSNQEFYRNFVSDLLFVGVVTSGITTIMGIFLSQEEGYAGTVLNWHKWSGVSVFFVASFIYTSRDRGWYKAPVARAGALITTLCLIFAGHFGAALTHGDNFIWQPVTAQAEKVVVAPDDAMVFDHVIRPIFENKCISCHNPDKMKGKLSMVDSTAILKGGKTGALFVSGRPDTSLLVSRIDLPMSDKKHMPPSGKPQLTPDEITLINLWIRGDDQFSQRVAALPPSDTLRIVATKFLEPAEAHGEKFRFVAADESTIQNLNTNYCVVSPLAKESPALAVNMYSRASYTPETLDKLKAVKTQIISLALSRMPVKNEDLKKIIRFENLRQLNLNFTDITGAGLITLTSLKELRSLYLSGTKITVQDLQKYLADFKSLRTVAVWDTGLSTHDLKSLQATYKHIHFLGGFRDDGKNPIKLNAPQIKNKSIVFDDSLSLELFHPVKDVDIRFTVDGSDPDSVTSPVFAGKTIVHQTTTIRAQAYKQGWITSNVAALNVFKSGHKPDTVMLRSKLNRVHPANGSKTFFDHQLGTFNANSPAWANNWAGFIKNDMDLLLEYKRPRMISSVAVNTLVEMETVIFPPAAIEVWGGDSEHNLRLLGKVTPKHPKDYIKPYIETFECTFKPERISFLKVIAKPVMKIPDWHRAKDRPALLLIDEIFVN